MLEVWKTKMTSLTGRVGKQNDKRWKTKHREANRLKNGGNHSHRENHFSSNTSWTERIVMFALVGPLSQINKM